MSSFFNGHSRDTSIISVPSSPKKKTHSSFDKRSIIVPTVQESTYGSSIGARTAALGIFKELGPVDLVHQSRYVRHSQKEEGEYHFVTGIDLSSNAGPLAYITAWNLNNPPSTAKHPNIFTYCAFDAFSDHDIRIRVQFSNKDIDLSYQVFPADRSQKILNEVPDEMWDQLFVSGIVRSIISNLDIERKLPCLSQQLQFQNVSSVKYAITKIVKLLDKGYLLGASSDVQKPTNSENFLLDTLYQLVDVSGLYQFTIDLLKEHPSNYDLVILKLLFRMDNEIEAVKFARSIVKQDPSSSLLVNEQIKFLFLKGESQIALKLALASVKINPISFDCWYYLIKAQILNDDIHGALVSLNSAPMYPPRQKDILSINTSDTINLPLPPVGKVKSVWDDDLIPIYGPDSENQLKFSSRNQLDSVDRALIRTNSQLPKSTHKKAYELLVLMINKIGWDALLKIRGEVFIMDDEYKNMSVQSLHSQLNTDSLKQKRLCEKWLDNLFLTLYDDLRVVLIVENELARENQLKHSALEWELIGLTAFRAGHYRSGVASLRTAISAKFNIIAALRILELWEQKVFNKDFEVWNRFNKSGVFDIALDDVLQILVKIISYNVRFYDEFQLHVLLFLKKLFTLFDTDYIKNKVQVLFENDNNDFNNSGVIPAFDRLVAEVQYLNPTTH